MLEYLCLQWGGLICQRIKGTGRLVHSDFWDGLQLDNSIKVVNRFSSTTNLLVGVPGGRSVMLYESLRGPLVFAPGMFASTYF